jgi:glycerol-3-phosphate dehydrogenase
VGEEIVDKVYKKLGKSAPPCSTEHKPLPGAILPNDPRITKTTRDYEGKVPRQSIDHLFKVYGAKAIEVLSLTDSEPKLGELITPELPDIKAQVVYAVRHEYAHTLVDIARRRTAIAMEAHYGLDVLTTLIDTLKTYCAWDDYKCATARENYLSYMKNNCIPDFDEVDAEVEPRNWDREEVPLF